MNKQRKHYLVKPKLQLKYLTILGGIIVVSAIMIYYAFLNSLLTSPGMDQLSAGAVKNFVRSYTSGFFWATLIFAIIIMIESIFYFHRLIGPIFFFEKLTRQLANGEFNMNVYFRKKDETKDLAKNMNQFIENVRNTVLEDRNKIEKIKNAIDSGDNEKAKVLLAEVTQWFKVEKQ